MCASDNFFIYSVWKTITQCNLIHHLGKKYLWEKARKQKKVIVNEIWFFNWLLVRWCNFITWQKCLDYSVWKNFTQCIFHLFTCVARIYFVYSACKKITLHIFFKTLSYLNVCVSQFLYSFSVKNNHTMWFFSALLNVFFWHLFHSFCVKKNHIVHFHLMSKTKVSFNF